MESARCLCPHDSQGKKCGRHQGCPIHGYSSPNPLISYFLTYTDKTILRGMRIDPEDTVAIQEIRQADEDRFNPPRQK